MKTTNNPSVRRGGFALILVLILIGVSLLILAGVMNRTQSVATLNQRNNIYNVRCAAAEAAVEKTYARMVFDFQRNGPGGVSNNWAALYYQTNIPNTTESSNSYWADFVFSDANGNSGRTYVQQVSTYGGPLPSAYTGLYCTSNSPIYRIVSNVTGANSNAPGASVVGTAQIDMLLALVPLNTWAIFYNGLLEFSTCAPMTVNGRVQANGSIYVGSGSTLTFNSGVSCTGTLSSPANDGQGPWTSSTWNVAFNGTPGYTTNVASVTVSLNMTNSHFMIDIPPAGESPTSTTGQQRLYNEAYLVLLVTNSATGGTNPAVQLTIQSSVNGAVPGNDSAPTVLSYTNASSGVLSSNLPFLSLTNTAYDRRESDTNIITQIDVGRLDSWMKTNTYVQTKLPASSSVYPTILYVADRRVNNAHQLSSVRLVNGAQLPANGGNGFTVATPNPLYVLGNYNVQTASSATNASAATTNTTYTVPAALFSDALTVLSSHWSDAVSFTTAYSTGSSAYNATSSDTINAAIITGTVPSTGTTSSTFSGGVHNLPRLLEDWSNDTLWLNTSILRLWDSNMATSVFQNPGVYYAPPTRNFSFDPKFLSPNGVPPGIPVALVPIRFGWLVPPPNSVTTQPTYN